MAEQKVLLGQTPWQTVGPFFHFGLLWKGAADLTGASDIGARPDMSPPEYSLLPMPAPRRAMSGKTITIAGHVVDGDGKAVPDALVEIWQANANGLYQLSNSDPDFSGFGRSATSAAGEFRFQTIRPGRVEGPEKSLQAPHIAIGVQGRGLLKRLVTRLYFPDGEGLEKDPILNLVPQARRRTLIARQQGDHYRFDIVLQGENETVFFDC